MRNRHVMRLARKHPARRPMVAVLTCTMSKFDLYGELGIGEAKPIFRQKPLAARNRACVK
jgi:hypothetical protein